MSFSLSLRTRATERVGFLRQSSLFSFTWDYFHGRFIVVISSKHLRRRALRANRVAKSNPLRPIFNQQSCRIREAVDDVYMPCRWLIRWKELSFRVPVYTSVWRVRERASWSSVTRWCSSVHNNEHGVRDCWSEVRPETRITCARHAFMHRKKTT